MRLIDKDDLLDFFENHAWDWESVDGITATTVLRQVITDIRNAPSIDFVKCGECKYYKRDFYNMETVCTYHMWAKIFTTSEEYCSHGEPKSDRVNTSGNLSRLEEVTEGWYDFRDEAEEHDRWEAMPDDDE